MFWIIQRISLATLVCGLMSNNIDAISHEFGLFVDEYWSWRFEQSPEFSTKAGTHLYNDKWQDLTEETFTKDKMRAEEFLIASQEINKHDLNKMEVITLKVIQNNLETYISGYKFRKYTQYNPISSMGNPFGDWSRIIGLMPLKTETDFNNLIQRLKGLGSQIDQMITLMRVAINENTTHHSSSLVGFENRLEGLKSDIDSKTSYFQNPFLEIPTDFTDEQKNSITEEADKAINEIVNPALTRFGDFVKDEYAPNTRPDPAITSLRGGDEVYAECLKWHLGVTLSVQEVHDLGLSEVERIEQNIYKLIDDAGFNGTMFEYLTYLKTLPSSYYETEAAMLDGYRDIIANTRSNLATVLPQIPDDCPVIVEQNMNPQSWARYTSPSADGTIPGKFIINVFNPETRPTFGMTSLTLHEVEPGHHTQACYQLDSGADQKGRLVAYRKYYAVPFNFPFFTAFSEGWALYSEGLGEEMGVYDTSNKLLGRYFNEIFRAARLVVDTGIHALGWTKESAVDYLSMYSIRSREDMVNEMNRYITWPGQACSYKSGELTILKIRAKAEKDLGDEFDLRKFHDQILKLGDVPMTLLEEVMDTWMVDQVSKTEVVGGAEGVKTGVMGMIICLLSYFLM